MCTISLMLAARVAGSVRGGVCVGRLCGASQRPFELSPLAPLDDIDSLSPGCTRACCGTGLTLNASHNESLTTTGTNVARLRPAAQPYSCGLSSSLRRSPSLPVRVLVAPLKSIVAELLLCWAPHPSLLSISVASGACGATAYDSPTGRIV